MTAIGLVVHQARYDLTAFRRDPASVFFTAVLPVIFLSVLVAVFGGERLEGSGVRLSTYYVPGILALAVVSGTFVNLAMSITTLREDGVLKRLRGTPLPPWAFLAGRVASSLVLTSVVTVVLLAVGRVGYGVSLPGRTLPGFLLALLVGAASFSCLGVALTGVIPSTSAASAITTAVVLPLYFISGTFFPSESIPALLRGIADVFPIKHLAEALFASFDPATAGSGVATGDLAVVAAWGVAGLLFAVRFFAWTPRQQAG